MIKLKIKNEEFVLKLMNLKKKNFSYYEKFYSLNRDKLKFKNLN